MEHFIGRAKLKVRNIIHGIIYSMNRNLNSTKNKSKWVQNVSSTVGRPLYLHMAEPGLILKMPYGPLKLSAVFPECRAKSNH